MTDDLRVVVDADADPLVRELRRAGVEVRGFGSAVSRTSPSARAFSAAVDKQKESLRGLSTFAKHASFAIGTGLALAIGHAIKVGADFESQMARVQAVTDATGQEMDTLRELAIKLGADTKFSAGQAAEAMYELSSAGFTVKQTSDALPGTLSLAAASSIELADAAEISSNALKGFGLDADESTHVADVLAKSVNSSSVEMLDLQLSLKYIGPIARVTGESFEQMIAAVSLMGDAGIKGEQAGTSIRGGLLRLVKPTKQVKEGLEMVGVSAEELQGPNGLLPLPQLVGKLQEGMEGLSKADQAQALASIFGNEALSGMLTVVEAGPAKLRRLTAEFEHSNGASAKAAKTMNDTVKGSFEQLKGSLETFEITMFELVQEPLKAALLDATNTVNVEGKKLQTALDEAISSPEFDRADLGGKLDILASTIGDEWRRSGIGEEIGDVMIEAFNFALPRIAEAAGHGSIIVAKAFVEGFLESDELGKLVIGGWLMSKFGGFAALRASGLLIGKTVAEGAAASTVGGAAVKQGAASSVASSTVQGVTGGAAGAAAQSGWRGMLGKMGLQLGPAGEILLPVAVTFGAAAGAHKALQEILGDELGDIASKGTSSTIDLGSGLDDIKALFGGDEDNGTAEREKKIEAIYRRSLTAIQFDQIAGLKKLNADLAIGLEAVDEVWEKGSQPWRETVAKTMRQAVMSIRAGMRSGVIGTKEGQTEINHLLKEIHLTTGNDPLGVAEGAVASFRKARGITSKGVNELVGDLEKMPPKAREAAVDSIIGMAQKWAQGRPKLEAQVNQLSQFLGNKFGQTNQQLTTGVGHMVTGIAGMFDGLAGAVGQALEGMNTNVSAALKAYGVTKLAKFSVHTTSAAADAVGDLASGAADMFGFKADGGFVAGKDRRDHALFALGSDEAVVNVHQQPEVQAGLAVGKAMGVTRHGSLQELFSGVTKPNYLAKGGFSGGEAAKLPRPTIGGPDVLAGLGQAGVDIAWKAAEAYLRKHMKAIGGGDIVAVGHQLERLGYELSEHPAFGGVHPVHTEGSDHYSGHAVDVNDDSSPFGHGNSEMQSLDWLGPQLMKIPHKQIIWRNHDLDTGAPIPDHMDHLHLAMAAGGFVREMIRGLASGGLTGLVGGNFDINEAATLAHVAGMKSPGLMGAITAPESGGDPSIVNSIGATGLWQIYNHPDLVAKYGPMTDPWNNARAAKDLQAEGGTAPWVSSESGWAGATKGVVSGALAEKMRTVIGGGDADAGPTQGETKKAEAKKKKAHREALLKKLRNAVGNAKTLPGKRGALWQLAEFWGEFGLFDEDSRERMLSGVRDAADEVNPLGAIPVLSNLMDYLNKNVEISGRDLGDKSLADEVERVQKQGTKVGDRRRKKKLKRLEGKGLDKKRRDTLDAIDRGIEKSDETIDIHSRQASSESGPGGSEYTDGETTDLTGLNRGLLGDLFGRRDLLKTIIGDLTQRIQKSSEEIHAARSPKSRTHWKLAALVQNREGARTLIDEMREGLDDTQGVTGGGGRIFDVQMAIDELGAPKTGAEENAGWTAAKEAIAEQTLQNLAISQGETRVFGDFFRELGTGVPYLGAYMRGTGGMRIGQSGLAMLHRDEMVTPDPKGPAGTQFAGAQVGGDGGSPQITLVLKDRAGDLVELIDARVDGKVAKVDQQLGAAGRRRAVAPGRV